MSLPDYQWLRERVESARGQVNVRKAHELEGVARELGVPLTQMAIAWCLKNPNVSTVILGASNAQQLAQNLTGLDLVPRMTDDVMEKIEAVLGNRPELPKQF